MGGKCGSISRPADEVQRGLWKKQRAHLARALGTMGMPVPCFAWRGEGLPGGQTGGLARGLPAARPKGQPGSTSSQGVQAVPTPGLPGPQPCPRALMAFLGLPRGHVAFVSPRLAEALGRTGGCAGAWWCSVAHPAPAGAFPREALPAGSMGQAALPITGSPHCRQRPPVGRLATQNIYLPARRMGEKTR